jgi:hypothetical protein
MKLKEEWFLDDQRSIAERNASVLAQIFRGEIIYGSETDKQADRDLRYVDSDKTSVKTSGKSLFQRPTRKSK